jgi:hypothetical protein
MNWSCIIHLSARPQYHPTVSDSAQYKDPGFPYMYVFASAEKHVILFKVCQFEISSVIKTKGSNIVHLDPKCCSFLTK